MKRTRVAGIIPLENGFAFMHRINVNKEKEYKNYYSFIGGGLEKGETEQEGVIREIKEELGIEVKIIKKLYEVQNEEFNQKEVYFLCEYIKGKFGTGNGPEFDHNPKYKDSGEYIPEIIKTDNIEKIFLLPIEIKEKLIKDIKEGKIK